MSKETYVAAILRNYAQEHQPLGFEILSYCEHRHQTKEEAKECIVSCMKHKPKLLTGAYPATMVSSALDNYLSMPKINWRDRELEIQLEDR